MQSSHSSQLEEQQATDALNKESIALMEQIKQGDEMAFERLVELHQHAVIGTVAKMLCNHADAHDIAQQVFLRVWKSAARYRPEAKFTTWLFTITRNLVFNEMRRRKRHPQTSLEETEEEYHIGIPDDEHRRPDAENLQAELEKVIDDAIASLPEKQRMAVILRRYEDLAYEEIGEVLKLTVPAVKSLLFRARTQLREKLEPYLGTTAD
jgi:RNA polymerase sigma-70 factor (ECF subfamily)